MSSAFLSLAPFYPLLTLHYWHFSLLTGGRSWVCSLASSPLSSSPLSFTSVQVVSVLQQRRKSQAPSHHLLYHCLLPLVAGSESPLMNTVRCVCVNHLPLISVLCLRLHTSLTSLSSDGTLEEETLIQQLVNFDLSSPTSCMRALQLAKVEGSERVLPFLCRHLVTHPFSSISSPAASLTIRILAGQSPAEIFHQCTCYVSQTKRSAAKWLGSCYHF